MAAVQVRNISRLILFQSAVVLQLFTATGLTVQSKKEEPVRHFVMIIYAFYRDGFSHVLYERLPLPYLASLLLIFSPRVVFFQLFLFFSPFKFYLILLIQYLNFFH